MLEIENYPEARFDKENGLGFLCYYSKNQHSLYNLLIDYKAGTNKKIESFVSPFLKLIQHTMKEVSFKKAYLIPIPSSKEHNDPTFNKKPSTDHDDPTKNRDNRNNIFCKMLSKKNSNLYYKDILKRVKGKESKKQKTHLGMKTLLNC